MSINITFLVFNQQKSYKNTQWKLDLAAKIEQRITFARMIGLSYVGLPWAAVFSLAGFAVLGFDKVTYANAVLFAVSKNYFRQLADRFVAGSSGDWKLEEPR